MDIAYDVFEINGKDCLDYRFAQNEIGLIGRACKNMCCKEVLLTKSGTQFEILKIYSYGRELTEISSGMSCALVIKAIDKDGIFYHDAQKLRGQSLFTIGG